MALASLATFRDGGRRRKRGAERKKEKKNRKGGKYRRREKEDRRKRRRDGSKEVLLQVRVPGVILFTLITFFDREKKGEFRSVGHERGDNWNHKLKHSLG